MKVQTMVTIDENLKRMAKRHEICISKAISDYLQVLVDRQNQNIDGINIEITRNKIVSLQKKITDLQVELNSLQKDAAKWEDIQEKNEEKRLNEEKEIIESQKKCINCGNIIQFKSHKFNAGKICNPCFLGSDSESIKKWSKTD